MTEIDYVVSYTLPATGRVWHTFSCPAINSLEAVRKCCTEIPSANIKAVFARNQLERITE